ncbi:TPA: hypothetical protein ACH3X2_005078 [Trebouxia sp. C0005]
MTRWWTCCHSSTTPRRAGYDVTHSKHLAESSTQKSRSRLLRGKKLKPVELCSYTLAHKIGKEMMWSMMHNNSKARCGPVVFLIHQHEP